MTNLLPRLGNYEDMVKSSVVRLLLSPKDTEGKEHSIGVRKGTDGVTTFICDDDFTKDIWLSPLNWEYTAGILKELQKKGQLPVDATGLYEKLVLLPYRDE